MFSLLSACSQPEPIVCGIAPGSILGPLLSIIYINDLPNASNLLKTFSFADDTSLFYSHKDPNQLIHVMNCELSKISEWLKVNKLSLNVAKTNYILFLPRQKPITVSDTITLDNIAVQQVEVTKFLGVLLDQHLSWKYHITHVAKKVSKAIGIISKARFFLSSKSLLSLYYTLVYPYLNCCNITWCSTYPSKLNRILYQLNILPILHLFFGLLISLTFLTLMRSLLRVLCTHIIITSFLIRLTPPLLLIAKYTHIILEMLITTDLISVEKTLNSSQFSI